MHRRNVRLAAAWLLLACTDPAQPADPDVPVAVDSVVIDDHDVPVVLLEERDGARMLPIWIGNAEATSIARQLRSIPAPRPDTHDTTTRLIEALDGRVERVVVTSLDGDTFYALLALRTANGLREIDVRPSDGIAIALRTGAPLFVRESVLGAAGQTPAELPGMERDRPQIPDGSDPATRGRSI